MQRTAIGWLTTHQQPMTAPGALRFGPAASSYLFRASVFDLNWCEAPEAPWCKAAAPTAAVSINNWISGGFPDRRESKKKSGWNKIKSSRTLSRQHTISFRSDSLIFHKVLLLQISPDIWLIGTQECQTLLHMWVSSAGYIIIALHCFKVGLPGVTSCCLSRAESVWGIRAELCPQ